MKDLSNTLKLCLVTKIGLYQSFEEYSTPIHQAIKGGVTMLQLREKHFDFELIKQRAVELRLLLRPYKIPLIINDLVELALEIDADGVHIGQRDMSPLQARKLLGPNKIIGLSVESIEELLLSNEIDEVDYVSISAVLPSKTKTNYKKIWGLDGVTTAVQFSKHPITAIGGITLRNAANIMQSGVDGLAVIGAIYDQEIYLKLQLS